MWPLKTVIFHLSGDSSGSFAVIHTYSTGCADLIIITTCVKLYSVRCTVRFPIDHKIDVEFKTSKARL